VYNNGIINVIVMISVKIRKFMTENQSVCNISTLLLTIIIPMVEVNSVLLRSNMIITIIIFTISFIMEIQTSYAHKSLL
jgi:hypothetical protein